MLLSKITATQKTTKRILFLLTLLMVQNNVFAQEKTPFLWGVASAAYQVEGAYQADGKGVSNWDVYTNKYEVTKMMTGKVESGNIAINHYDRAQYLEDIQLMKKLGVNCYRFSIAWTRLLPNGTGEVNQKGIEHYAQFIDDLLENGIEPCVTLFHWDMPQTLQEKGGFNNPDFPKWFSEYANLVFQSYGKKVKKFITFNEPYIDLFLIEPLVQNIVEKRPVFGIAEATFSQSGAASHHLLLAHAKAVADYRNLNLGGLVGITLSLSPSIPADTSKAAAAAAQMQDGMHNEWFLNPLLKGSYPKAVLAAYQKVNPSFQPTNEEMAFIKKVGTDFIGVNFYAPSYVRAEPKAPFGLTWFGTNPDPEPKMFNGPVRPEYFYKLLMSLKNDYGNPLMYITENGAGFGDKDDNLENGVVNDQLRIGYVQKHIEAALRARKDGANLQGYMLWSIFDNFEWISGYKSRFGIIHVDFETQKRIPKNSFYEYQKIIEASKKM